MVVGTSQVGPVAQEILEEVARRGYYVLDVNPRQILPNNVGIDGYEGGGNFNPGESAVDLDWMLVRLADWPKATMYLDIGVHTEQWVPVTRADIARLREAFFILYGPFKKNWYEPAFQTFESQNNIGQLEDVIEDFGLFVERAFVGL